MPRSAAAGLLLAAVGLVLIVSLVSGCGPAAVRSPAASGGASPSSGTSPSAAGSEGASPAASPGAGPADVWLPEWADESTPDVVLNRRPLHFCGVERPPAPQPGIFIDRAVRLCFWNAHLAGQEAEFVSLQTSMEGAPFATIWRIAADGSVEQLVDFTQDAFGGGAWQGVRCDELVEGEGNELIAVSGCGDPVALE